MTLEETNKKYESACNEYIRLFCEKQGVDFEFWISDKIGETACFGDYCFNLSDIIFDINTDQPKGLILEWWDCILEEDSYINYEHYTMGARWEK